VAAAPELVTVGGLLDREFRALQTFVTLLRREQTLLEEGSTESLAALAEEKLRAAAELTDFSASRDSKLIHSGLRPGRAGMEAWTATAAGAGYREQWRELLELTAEARALNETNGKLIGIRLQNNQQALSILMAAADQAVTYGPDGQQHTGPGGRSLGRA
jgi:flagella synthesis protein FlgN